MFIKNWFYVRVFVNIFSNFSYFLYIFEETRTGQLNTSKMEDLEKNEDRLENDSKFREEIYSVAVRAGKRTYFFDVKSTRRDEFYLTITESKKRFEQDGNFHFEKHKIFLYKEDFEKFIDGLQEVITYIDQNQHEETENYAEVANSSHQEEQVLEEVGHAKDYTKLEFDDLNS